MSQHFSPEDLSRWVAGDRTSAMKQHAGECAACNGRLENLEATLGDFRGAMHDWTAARTPAIPVMDFERRTPSRMRRWALAAATLVILVSGSAAYWRRHEAALHAAEIARADALLQQVDSEISRAVPQPMEPLVSLVTWAPSPSNQNQTKELP